MAVCVLFVVQQLALLHWLACCCVELCGTFVPHVNSFMGMFVPSISDRLRAQREALGLSQQALAEKCNVSARSQRNYESGERQPDAGYLAAVAAAGANVRYILTGDPEGPPPLVLTGEEQLLLEYYRDAPAAVRKAAMAVLLSASAAPAGQSYVGSGGVQIGTVAGGRVRVSKK